MAMRRSRPQTARETPRAVAPAVPIGDRRETGGEEQAPDRAERSEQLRRRIRDIYRRYEAGFKYLAER